MPQNRHLIEAEQKTHIGTANIPLEYPQDIAVDPDDHRTLYVADMLNHRIALVDLAGATPTITTFAGTAKQSGNADGSRTSSLFNEPSSVEFVVVDGKKILYVADKRNNAVRAIDRRRNGDQRSALDDDRYLHHATGIRDAAAEIRRPRGSHLTLAVGQGFPYAGLHSKLLDEWFRINHSSRHRILQNSFRFI